MAETIRGVLNHMITAHTVRGVPVETRRARPTLKVPPARLVAEAAFKKRPPIAVASVGGGGEIPPYRFIEVREILTNDWVGYRDNPQQRDVRERIAKGRATHLLTMDESHRKVAIGVLPDGTEFKVDGHTRAFIWRHSDNTGPVTVFADIWQCRDIAAVKSLYDKYDNALTTETGSDRVTGAANENQLQFETPMMRAGEISSAVRGLWQYLEKSSPKRGERSEVISRAVKRFAPELVALDSCAPTKRRFPTAVVMAAIVTLRGDRKAALQFWTDYSQGMGEKVGGMRDAITVFEARLVEIRKKATGTMERETMCEAVAAVRAYSLRKSYTDKRGYTSISTEQLREYTAQAFGGN